MVDRAQAFAERYIKTEMSLDPTKIVHELYCEDAVLEAHGTFITGRAALETFYADFLSKVESVHLELGRVAGTGDDVAFEWRSQAVLKSGERAEAAGLDFITLRGDCAVRNTVYVLLSANP